MTELYESVLERAKKSINGGVVSEETRVLVDMAVKLHGCLYSVTMPENKPAPVKEPMPRTSCKKTITDEELLGMAKVTPEIAAKYLQNGTNAHNLRLDAQEGICPFMRAFRDKGRYSYRVNVGLLIRYKNGELGL